MILRASGLRVLRVTLAICTAVALGAAATAMYAAWQHNPQEEFHGAGGVEWGAWLFIGMTWFLAVWIPTAGLVFLVWYLERVSARTGSGETAG